MACLPVCCAFDRLVLRTHWAACRPASQLDSCADNISQPVESRNTKSCLLRRCLPPLGAMPTVRTGLPSCHIFLAFRKFMYIPCDAQEKVGAPANGTTSMVVRLQPDVVEQLLLPGPEPKEALFTWQVELGELHIVVASRGNNEIAARCELVRVDTLTTVFDLRQEAAFMNAPVALRKAWREVITRKKKPMFKWYLAGLEVPHQRLVAPPGRSMSSKVPLESLQCDDATTPQFSLRSTAHHFISRLSAEDRRLLAETAKFLNGKEIRAGTTCSGTDGCINVLRATVDVLNEEFQASRMFCTSPVPYIYIYTYAYIYIYIYSRLHFNLSQVAIRVKHCFSAEIEPFKQQFIMDAHVKPGEKASFHLYTDVKAFPDGAGKCVTCGKIHNSTEPIDVLFAGVSCKLFSGDNADRRKYSQCCWAYKNAQSHACEYM